MATPQQVQRRGRWSLILGTLFAAVLFAAVAYADNVLNDVVAGGNDTITAGGSTTVNYRIQQTGVGNDGQAGCNAEDASPATVTINTPSGVTVDTSGAPGNQATLTFTLCGTNLPAVFTSNTVGNHTITASVSDTGTGTYNTSHATFTLHVNAPADSTAPVITPTVTGTPGTNNWYTSDVALSWSVIDDESTISSQSGCDAVNVTADHAGATYTCTATSAGGTATRSVTIKRDATNPEISAAAGTYVSGSWTNQQVTVKFACLDAMSGLLGTCPSDVVVSDDTVAAGQNVSASVSDNAGNSASSNTINVKVDKTAPTIIGSRVPLPNVAGWNNTDVVVSFSCGDALSGKASCGPTPVTVSSDSANQSVLGTAVDNAGNSATATVSGINIDQTDPVVNCGSAPAPWSDGDVLIACTASDSLSGLAVAGDSSFNLSTSVAEGSETANASTNSRSVLDRADNSATAGPVSGIKVDKKAPTFVCDEAPTAWSASDISISCTAADGGSGLVPVGDASFSLTTNLGAGAETANASTGSKLLSDGVGHTVTAPAITGLKVDMKAPAITCGSADGQWHNDNVSIVCTATDGGSGVAPAADESFSLATTVAAGFETSNAATSSKIVADAVGNSTTGGPISGNKIDRKAPTVTPTCPATILLGSNVSGSWSATDGGSGVATGFVAGTIPLNTTSVGSKTMTVSAGASKDNVGNSSALATCTYTVIYDWSGFFQPIDNGLLNKAKAGSTVPVKFSLGGDQGLSIFEAGYPLSALYTCGDVASADLIEEYAPAGTTSGLKYDPVANQYIYNWKTESTWSGKCRQLRVKLADGTMHTASFNFFK